MPFPQTHDALARALSARGYADPTPVQAAVLAPEAAGRDLLVSAQTGSGKTVAFGLALAPTLLEDAPAFGRPGRPLALVVAPTRELAVQVQGELDWLYAEAGARIVACVGGTDPRFGQRALAAGCHIVVGTPGRLRDHIERGQLDLSALRAVVLDEADEMLDLGFREDLEFLLDAAPAGRRTLLFSATIAPAIAALARTYQADALRIDTQARRQHADIEYRAVLVAAHETESALVNVLRYDPSPSVLVFCATREGVRRLHARLESRGFAAVALSGELSQADRTAALQAIRDGRARVCVATDVAARGLDLPDLALVVHADLPTDRETLLHRSGRTGRAGRKGTSVLLVPAPKRRRAEQLLTAAGLRAAWSAPPSAADIRARDEAALFADPVLAEPVTEEESALAHRLLEGRSAEDVAAAFARLWRARLPAPVEAFEAIAPAAQRHAARPPADRPQSGAVWFAIGVGRRRNADPKWLLPLLCRAGEVTREQIGAIRVLESETRFEVTAAAAPRFANAVARDGEREFRIFPVGEGAAPRGPARKPATWPRRRSQG